jgi:DNA-binding MurR/RpiR family transcriptional regulator
LIRSKDGKTVAIILTGVIQASAVQEEAKVTFNRYGDQYFLSQVWMPGTDYARQLRKSDVELRAASSGAQKETVSITAKR